MIGWHRWSRDSGDLPVEYERVVARDTKYGRSRARTRKRSRCESSGDCRCSDRTEKIDWNECVTSLQKAKKGRRVDVI